MHNYLLRSLRGPVSTISEFNWPSGSKARTLEQFEFDRFKFFFLFLPPPTATKALIVCGIKKLFIVTLKTRNLLSIQQ